MVGWFFLLFLRSFASSSLANSPSISSTLSAPSIPLSSSSSPSSTCQQKPIQLAFGLMIYQKDSQSIQQVLESFHRLFDSIYTPHNHLYLIHLDIKSDPYLHFEIQNICSKKDNCYKIYSRNVAWGSLSTGEMMLALMQEALEVPSSPISWEYFLLLGHESLPVVSLSRIEEILTSYPSGTNFMNCWSLDGYNFFGQHEQNQNRLTEVFVDNFAGSLVPASVSSPSSDSNGQGKMKRSPPGDIIFYKSLQQMILSVEFVRYAVYGPLTKRIMLYLTNVRTSDEMLFPTILQVIDSTVNSLIIISFPSIAS
jgi:hypothetical protein